jgi:formate dehydrogenase subunit delta
MNSKNLIKMANQIGDFFATMPDQEQAAKDVAEHLNKFWEPRMRKNLLNQVELFGDDALKPVVRKAIHFTQTVHNKG